MSIEKRGEMWWYRFQARGREYRRTTGLAAERSNLREAESIEARAKLEIIAGVEEPNPAPSALFESAAEAFIEWCFSTEYRSKPNTARRIQISFQSLRVFFDGLSVSEIDANAIEDYKTWRIETHGVRDVTLRHDLHALSVFFRKYAVRKGLATSNPTTLVSKPSDKESVRIHILTPEEESAYFAHARGTLYDVARLMLMQGCRPEEIVSLRPAHVDLATATLKIVGGKTRAAKRELPLADESVAILRRRIEKDKAAKWLFPSPRIEGGHIVKLNAQHDRACIDAGVSFVLYDLRHTWATRALTEAGMDVGTVAAMMGHASPTIVLKHYVHPTMETKRAGMKKYEELMRPKLRRVK